MSSLSSFAELTVPAGKIEPINAEGRNFHVIFAPTDIEIKIPGGEFGIYQQGSGLNDLPDGRTFRRLEIKNPTTSDIRVLIYIGGPQYRDSRAAVIEPKTAARGWAPASLAATTGATFTGVPAGRQIRRKSIQVTNLDPTLTLQVRDTSGNVILTVFAETSIILPISEPVEIYNQNPAAVACNISEIFWQV